MNAPLLDQSCDFCRSKDFIVIQRAKDFHFHTPGLYRLMRCRQCGLIWLDAGPSTAEDSLGYGSPEYAPHRTASVITARFEGVKSRLKRAALAARRGYPAGSLSWAERLAGRLAAVIFAGRLDRVPRYIAGGRLLDVGCGAGTYAAAMKALGWSVIGLEPAVPVAVAAARRGELDMVAGRIEEAPLQDGLFDAVTFWHVLEHTYSPARALSQALRVLRPGGSVLVEVPNIESWQARLFGRYWFHLDPPRHRYHFSEASLRAYLLAKGFGRVRIRHVPSAVGIAGSFQAVLNRLTGRRGRAIQENRLVLAIWWPLAALEALLRHGGCLRAEAYAI